LTKVNRNEAVPHDVHVSGSFVTLLLMIDGQTGSDALSGRLLPAPLSLLI